MTTTPTTASTTAATTATGPVPPIEKVRVRPGDIVTVKLPWSGAVMHLRLADQIHSVQLTPAGMAQILTPDGQPVSFPVTAGEAGIYHDADGYYTYPAV
ncbi:hypothetical protein KBX50_08355 [Micromonospora sp. C51]|uniref:hypothetical protein n=1 Tax=Micromonospora sp. C51 TaxID=2824879 RepID=UPI001B38CBEB|nr:hypothetical protein [Micromonospora sp. C51]MBQ1048475.1 hypothetical protein [Micromonospora sp. C51]